jgi:hypothetical protein
MVNVSTDRKYPSHPKLLNSHIHSMEGQRSAVLFRRKIRKRG